MVFLNRVFKRSKVRSTFAIPAQLEPSQDRERFMEQFPKNSK